VFERFTERARQVVVLAQDEARSLNHNYIGTEHLLLGLLREEEGLAARVLTSLGVDVEDVRADVARIIGVGDEIATGQIPFTPGAKKVLELSMREAVSLGHQYIGTEHIQLGLARENEGVGARILLDFGVDAETLRNEVIQMLSGPRRRPDNRQAGRHPRPSPPNRRRWHPRSVPRSSRFAVGRKRRSSNRTSSVPRSCAIESGSSSTRRDI
jgi:ATP-dependent Clp protease ATP-binding subunit ClpC